MSEDADYRRVSVKASEIITDEDCFKEATKPITPLKNMLSMADCQLLGEMKISILNLYDEDGK